MTVIEQPRVPHAGTGGASVSDAGSRQGAIAADAALMAKAIHVVADAIGETHGLIAHSAHDTVCPIPAREAAKFWPGTKGFVRPRPDAAEIGDTVTFVSAPLR